MNPHERQQPPPGIPNGGPDADNEHFHLAESLISWMEYFKSTREDNPDHTLSNILSSATSRLHQTSPPIVAWNLVNIFGRKQKCEKLLTALSTAEYKDQFNSKSSASAAASSACRSLLETSERQRTNDNPEPYLHRNDKEILAIVSEYTTVSAIQIDALESTVIHEDNVRQLISNPEQLQVVISLLLSWLGDQSNYKHLNGFYYAANHLLKTILDHSPVTEQIDQHNCILIDVCLAHPGSVQVFSPYLSPNSCSAQCFLDLYKTICSKQVMFGPMATFVSLSKFDIKSWLSNANCLESKKGYHELIVTTCSAFKDIGKEPDKSYELTMDLFRRHLQIELAAPIREKPDELFLVLGQFLNLMDEQVLAPNLWMDFLIIIGLNHDPKQEDCCKMTSITENVARLAECQTIFDHHSLCVLVQSISEYLRHRYESNGITLLQLYQDYVEQYGVVMLCVTFMWIKSTSDAMVGPNDKNDLIWKQFFSLWIEWVLPMASCNSKQNYNLIVNCFVFSLQYMIHKMPTYVQSILQSVLSELSAYMVKMKDDTSLRMESTVLQRCLKNLPWSSLSLEGRDVENLLILSSDQQQQQQHEELQQQHHHQQQQQQQQTSFNMSDLVSHILMQINIEDSLKRMYEEGGEVASSLAQVAEGLATMIICLSDRVQSIQMPAEGRYFGAIHTNSIPRLASLMLARVEYISLANDDLMFSLLRSICLSNNGLRRLADATSDNTNSKQEAALEAATLTFDNIERAVIYARFVSDYLVDLTKKKPALLQSGLGANSLTTVINNSLMDLEPILQSEGLNIEQRKILYATLLKCANCDVLDANLRLSLARLFAESNSMKNKPQVVVDMLQSIGQFVRDPRILVNMVEILVDLYHSITGQYEAACRCFHLTAVQVDLYLNACARERSPMALMIYYESQLFRSAPTNDRCVEALPESRGDAVQSELTPHLNKERALLWSSYLFWFSRLIHRLTGRSSSTSASISVSAFKIATILIRLLASLEADLEQFILSDCLSDASGTSGDADPGLSMLGQASLMESMSGDNLSSLEQRPDSDQANQAVTNNNSTTSVSHKSSAPVVVVAAANATVSRPTVADLLNGHKCLLGFVKQLSSFYDSINSGGLWSYLKSSSNRNEQSYRIGITSLTVACFLADRALLQLAGPVSPLELPAHLEILRDELIKSRRFCLAKLEAARRSKGSIDCSQFIDSFVESVQQNSKVQYGEVVQLIATFVLVR